MKPSSPFSPRRLSLLLAAAILAALALPCLAQAPASLATPAIAADASFVASLAAPAPAPVLAPVFLQSGTGCTSNSQCPPGTLCCRACGYPGCTLKACLTARNGHCPLVP